MNCRFGPKQTCKPLAELTPGANEIVCELEVIRPGEFDVQLHLYVDDQGAREIVFQIRGEATGSKTSANKAP
jgi:hypothetical protein